MRRVDTHPAWCGGGHVCSADRRGSHRSHPHTVDTEHGRIVLTRIRSQGGRDQVELRAVVELPMGDVDAQVVTRRVVADLCLSLGRHVGAAVPA